MRKVLVALDNSPAGRSVVGCARALGSVLDAEVEAVHVRVNGSRTARSTARAAGVALRVVSGPVVERLVQEGESEEVVALVLGARGTSASSQPLGATAAAVATALPKPVLVVPPDADPDPTFKRVLVPLEGDEMSSLVPRAIFTLAPAAEIDVVVLHVLDESTIPAFTDQPQYELPAWAREFLLRYCPIGLGNVDMRTRVGWSGELIPRVTEECECDAIALGWSQELTRGRAPVVRETLERSRRPVLLVPVRVVGMQADPPPGRAGAATATPTVA